MDLPSSTADSTTECACQYMTLVPRGLHFAITEWVQQRIPLHQSIWVSESEAYSHDDLTQESTSWRKHSVAVPIGTVHSQTKSDISIGYNSHRAVIWTKPGQHSYMWWQFATAEPASDVPNLRALGPVTALVGSWKLSPFPQRRIATLSEMAEAIHFCLRSDSYRKQQFPSALRIWRQVALSNWKSVSERVRDDSLFVDDLWLASTNTDNPGLKFRISCVRPDDPNYTRRDLIMAVANDLVPSSWTVDLKHYDVEIVLFLKEDDTDPCSHHFAVALALHPYQYLGCHSFSSGIVPPDVAPPYMTLTGIVRLRPSTAQLLLHLVGLKSGAVVLDPCVGIGTIAHECAYLKYVGLGGDIVLTPSLLGPQATTYSASIQNEQQRIAATLIAWDAANLPIRTGTVDAVVSDLPFGRLCLSTNKLQQLLPLVLNEMARVLRRNSGNIVLLCGHYKLVLEALEFINHNHGEQNLIWEFPCTAVFPVNIGGMLAWVIQVRRGPGIWQLSTFASEKIRKLTNGREISRLNPSAKKKKLQS
jgi:ubiquinone/menaquinone biosynthesis C-methylase UbiE